MNLQALTTAVTIHSMCTIVSITKKRDNRGLNVMTVWEVSRNKDANAPQR